MSLISIDINHLLNAALGIFMWNRKNLTLEAPLLPITNALIHCPNGVVIEFIQVLNFYIE